MKIATIVSIVIILLSFAVGIYLYPQLPDKMVSHWNVDGRVNGYMPKFWGLFLMPIISSIMLMLFLLLPKIDPLKENISQFRRYYDNFILLIILFMFYLDVLSIRWNQGRRFNFVQFLIPAFVILFYYAGILISHTKRNWFIGIRTPWTISSDVVWNKTHELGGRLFKIVAIISLIGLILPSIAFWLLIVPIMLVTVYVIIYSYFEHKKELDKQI